MTLCFDRPISIACATRLVIDFSPSLPCKADAWVYNSRFMGGAWGGMVYITIISFTMPYLLLIWTNFKARDARTHGSFSRSLRILQYIHPGVRRRSIFLQKRSISLLWWRNFQLGVECSRNVGLEPPSKLMVFWFSHIICWHHQIEWYWFSSLYILPSSNTRRPPPLA